MASKRLSERSRVYAKKEAAMKASTEADDCLQSSVWSCQERRKCEK